MKGSWLVLIALCLSVVAPAHADRDIVYAARYYAPPGSHRTSHSHLYRINPDGTGRTQLTFGDSDDDSPKWSPTSDWIAFTRQVQDGRSSLCLVRAAGGSLHTLLPTGPAGTEETYGPRWSPDGQTLAAIHWTSQNSGSTSVSIVSLRSRQVIRRFDGASDIFWSPDSRRAYLVSERGDLLLGLRTGDRIQVQNRVEHPVWRDAQTLIGLINDPDKGSFLRVIGTDGREKKRFTPIFPDLVPGMEGESPRDRTAALFPVPLSKLVYALNNHNSTVGVDWLFLSSDASAQHMHYLTEGQFLAWSADGSRFCTAPGRGTTPYEKRRNPFPVPQGASAEERRDDEYRLVWSAPLFVRAAKRGPMRQLTPRLSCVTGADWRRSPHVALQNHR